MRILLASSNPGKLREYQALAAGRAVEFALLPNFASLPAFDESAPTFAENAAGKALHYSRYAADAVIADDSGLVVPALGGAPGVNSARYAGPNATDADRIAKLLANLHVGAGPRARPSAPPARLSSPRARASRSTAFPSTGAVTETPIPARPKARFVCALALAQQGRVLAVFSDAVEGELLDAPRGAGGFGYDPIFFFPPLGQTFAEIPRTEKNRISHRGRAFAKLLRYLSR
ncbi:MAG: non-canonical purine NTP pyrophosphatase [Candidatus Acidiferrales bacterium]